MGPGGLYLRYPLQRRLSEPELAQRAAKSRVLTPVLCELVPQGIGGSFSENILRQN